MEMRKGWNERGRGSGREKERSRKVKEKKNIERKTTWKR